MATTSKTSNQAAILKTAKTSFVVEERPIPTPGPGELLVRNHSIAINPVDWKRQDLDYRISSYPQVLGSDIAGVVEAIGPSVSGFQAGDRVTGYAPNIRTGIMDHGAFQTYTVLPAISTARIPDSMNFNDAATVPMALATSGIAIFAKMGVPFPPLPPSQAPPKKAIFLVWGGASSIGTVAIQLAAACGFVVFTTASPHHHNYLKGLGAAESFDYRLPDVSNVILTRAAEYVKRDNLTSSISHAFDAISEKGTPLTVASILSSATTVASQPAQLCLSIPWTQGVAVPENVTVTATLAFSIGAENSETGKWLFNEWAPVALESGLYKPSPKVEVVGKGIMALQDAVRRMRAGVSGLKLVVEL